MRPSRSPLGFVIAALVALLLPVTQATDAINAERMISSSSLSTCISNSNFSASLFNVAFTPNVTIDLVVSAYGLSVFRRTLDPCQEGWAGLCPMNEGQIDLDSNIQLPASSISQIPGMSS
jgi:hypothetical protein